MLPLTTSAKIEEIFANQLSNLLPLFEQQLIEGDLLSYEQALENMFTELSNEVSSVLLGQTAEQVIKEYKAPAGSCPEKRLVSFRLRTGFVLQLPSLYLKRPPSTYQGSRSVILRHFKILGRNSLALCDKVAYMSMLCPSYEVAHEALNKFGTKVCLSSVRDITNGLAEKVEQYGEENLFLAPQETLADKRVVISVDGGRSRVREYKQEVSPKGYGKYDTPWREPKLFVIDTIDKDGKRHREELPIYGCRFGEEDMIDHLERYLSKLQIDQASEVQLIADGAQWIWKEIPALLHRSGVLEERLKQTVDHYHAKSYLHQLADKMPKYISTKQRNQYLQDFKDLLWEGNTEAIVAICKTIFKRPSKLVRRWITYFEKHTKRMQYADFKENGLLCGSGLIESGIRRIINLRFKNASTFWIGQNVEKLYALRAGILSKRWPIFMKNLAIVT